MRKRMVFTLLAVLSIVLIGCQSKDHDTANAANTTIKDASISTFETGEAKLHSNFFALYEDKKEKNVINHAITSAKKLDGIYDAIEPEFYVEITRVDGHSDGYYLWLGEKGQTSTIVDVKNTHVAYSVSKDATKQIIALIEEDLVH